MRDGRSSVEIGMSVERASWGRGFATEALTAVLRYLVQDEGIATVVAWCASSNIGSRRALEKAGMVQTDVEPSALQVGQVVHDKVWYAYTGGAAG